MFLLKNNPSEVRSPFTPFSIKIDGSSTEIVVKPKFKEIPQKKLVDQLNFIHFQDGTIQVNFTHINYNQKVTISAYPQPCFGNSLECLWTTPLGGLHKLNALKFDNFSFSEAQKIYLVEPEALTLNDLGVYFTLPETCLEIIPAQSIMHPCDGIAVRLIQNSAVFSGYLLGFHPLALYIQVHALPPQTYNWINRDSGVNVILSGTSEIIYSGECQIMDGISDFNNGKLVLTPIFQNINRFSPKEFRSSRQTLQPSPHIVFSHPLTQKTIDLKIYNISGTGFSVIEEPYHSVLLPGMVIPNLSLNFSDSFSISCKAQVIYRRILDQKSLRIRCGIAILDMDMRYHMKLLGILQQANNQNTYVCSKVNMEDLWHFFFETGFISPKKYAFIEDNKSKIKETYEKLYTQSPAIARHFVYQDKGQILGHMAMLRFYEETWLIHHHAANNSFSNRAGIVVLDQIGSYANDSHNLYSIHMKFLICYYQPSNKFPSRVFGGAATAITNRQGCSLDNFAYFHFMRCPTPPQYWPKSWKIVVTRAEDLQELNTFYACHSGGLSLEALDLVPERFEQNSLDQEYGRVGFKRKKYLYSLIDNDVLMAVLLVNVSDMGMNLSELTNSITVFVLDSNALPSARLLDTIGLLSRNCDRQEYPILLYPVSYADKYAIPYEKIYTLWVLNTQFGDAYFRHLKNLFRSVLV